MKSINVEVGGLVSSLSAEGVRRKLLQLPGVHHADVNYVAGSATVHLDEGQLSVEDLRQRIAECGYHCRGEQTPKHVCAPAARVSADPSRAPHGWGRQRRQPCGARPSRRTRTSGARDGA